MSVKVKLGGKLLYSENLLLEANNKISNLTLSIAEKEEELITLKNKICCLEKENSQLKFDAENYILSISKLEENLNEKIILSQSLQDELDGTKGAKDELLQVNKVLKLEIENLVECNKESRLVNYKFHGEMEETEKVKNKFENELILVTQLNEKLNDKIKSYESVLKQKEKYINILMKKKESNYGDKTTEMNGTQNQFSNFNKDFITINTNFDTLNDENKMKNKSKLQPSAASKLNIGIYQQKVLELQKMLESKDLQIKKLESEKNNLLTRLRNSSNK